MHMYIFQYVLVKVLSSETINSSCVLLFARPLLPPPSSSSSSYFFLLLLLILLLLLLLLHLLLSPPLRPYSSSFSSSSSSYCETAALPMPRRVSNPNEVGVCPNPVPTRISDPGIRTGTPSPRSQVCVPSPSFRAGKRYKKRRVPTRILESEPEVGWGTPQASSDSELCRILKIRSQEFKLHFQLDFWSRKCPGPEIRTQILPTRIAESRPEVLPARSAYVALCFL